VRRRPGWSRAPVPPAGHLQPGGDQGPFRLVLRQPDEVGRHDDHLHAEGDNEVDRLPLAEQDVRGRVLLEHLAGSELGSVVVLLRDLADVQTLRVELAAGVGE
jgi:hypothetical protein